MNEQVIYAKRDLNPGEEITYDYKFPIGERTQQNGRPVFEKPDLFLKNLTASSG